MKVLNKKSDALLFFFFFLFFFYMSLSFVIILFHDNARPRVTRMTLQKVTDSGYETLSHPPYSSDLSATEHYFFKRLDTFCTKNIRFHGRVETAFKAYFKTFWVLWYRKSMNNLVSRS